MQSVDQIRTSPGIVLWTSIHGVSMLPFNRTSGSKVGPGPKLDSQRGFGSKDGMGIRVESSTDSRRRYAASSPFLSAGRVRHTFVGVIGAVMCASNRTV